MKLLHALTVLVIVAVLGWMYQDWRSTLRDSRKVAAAVDTVRITDSVRVVVAETLTVRGRAKARVDTLVQTVTDTQLVVRESAAAPPETLSVHPLIVERIRTDSALIVSLYDGRRADSLSIAARDRLIALQKPPRKWGFGATAGWGCNAKGCGPGVTLGVSWRP